MTQNQWLQSHSQYCAIDVCNQCCVTITTISKNFQEEFFSLETTETFPIWLGFILTSSYVFFQLIHGAHMNIKILLEQVRVAIGTLPRDLVSVRVFPCKFIFLYQ